MHIVVFGASGPTGRQLTDQALAAGHRVTAVARRPQAVPPRAGLTVQAADATDPDAVDAAVAGADAVLSALGATPGRKPVTVYSAGATNILAAMRRQGVRRLVAVSSSAVDPAWRPSGEFLFNHLLDPYVNRVIARTAHQDMRRMEAVLRASDLDWTIARPSALFDHPVVTGYRHAEESADGLYTARADLAASMLSQLTDDRYLRRAMGVITTDVRPTLRQLLRGNSGKG
ncbi:NAD(P)-dependent oxidoreductase [Kitasatospora mediocidica]|uniref:NAD(P)-dependent oxidoreductase n=1 Tax=Kitasatospora mediocidica TaxID=58352 RepID=UPI00055F73F2|nr:NAD(P)H-binding protein [Kitasatospora mediocidica]